MSTGTYIICCKEGRYTDMRANTAKQNRAHTMGAEIYKHKTNPDNKTKQNANTYNITHTYTRKSDVGIIHKNTMHENAKKQKTNTDMSSLLDALKEQQRQQQNAQALQQKQMMDFMSMMQTQMLSQQSQMLQYITKEPAPPTPQITAQPATQAAAFAEPPIGIAG